MVRRAVCLFALILFAATAASAQAPAKRAKAPKKPTTVAAQPAAIAGSATSAKVCVGLTNTNVHYLGWAPAGTRVTITFSSDFDPIASLSLVQLGNAAADGSDEFDDWVDDDSGGNMEPLIRATTTFAATMVLYVSAYSQDDSGCYFYKVEVQTP